jgi:hypothetical protein
MPKNPSQKFKVSPAPQIVDGKGMAQGMKRTAHAAKVEVSNVLRRKR